MVATRRQVQAEPDEDVLAEQDPDLILKKKPVRRATAKTAANPKTETKPRTTRGKKAAQVAEPESDAEPEPEVLEVEEPALKKKAGRPKRAAAEPVQEEVADELVLDAKPKRGAKAGSVRGKRGAAAIAADADEQQQDEPKATKSAKSGTLRGKKATPIVVEEAEEEVVQPVKPAKPASVRGKKAQAVAEAPALQAPEEPKPARQTRGAASKPQPLSPKKITQVSKAQARNVKSTNQKAAAEKPPTRARATRNRTVSDENEDVVVFNATTTVPPVDNDVVMLSSTPKKTKTTRATRQAKQEALNESDLSMSSRPTTPTDSIQQSFNTIEEEEKQEEVPVSEDEDELDVKHDSGGSDDELCGPKTPMRRLSPSASARFQSSAQRTIRKPDFDAKVETPARRFAVLGSQLGTPQTQKPYCRPKAPTSDARPMTVARATGKAFVFKDLRDGRPSPRKAGTSIVEQEDASFLPDEDIITIDATPTPEEPIYLDSSLEAVAGAEEESTASNASIHEEAEAGFVAPAEVELHHEDLDETVIVHELKDEEQDPTASFHTEDTVLIGRPEQAESQDTSMTDDFESEEGSVVMHQSPAAAQSAQGMPKERVPVTSIFVDFDEHMTDARVVLEEDVDNYMITEEADPVHLEEDAEVLTGAQIETDEASLVMETGSRRQTVNFNDFIDVAALAEPTAVLNLDEAKEALKEFDTEEHHPAPTTDSDTITTASPTMQEAVQPAPAQETQNPHYALPTIAFDARRKSLPAFSQRTTVKSSARPNTSDGTSVPRTATSFANAWWNGARAGSVATTPIKNRPSTSHATPSATTFGTPTKSSPWIATPKERYPLLSSKKNNGGHVNEAAAPVSFGTPSKKSPARRDTFHQALPKAASAAATPKERYPVFSGRANYTEHPKTVAAPVRFQTPAAKSPKRRQTFHKAVTGQTNVPEDVEITTPVAPALETPQPTTAERFPKLRPRSNYADHAKTVAGPVRFQTPVKTPLKRPATAEKSDSLRRAALAANTPVPSSHTPMKTPLKAPGMTPSQVPMTPHPAAPLRGVLAIVEVYTLEGASASAPFIALLHRLGAKTTRSWSDRVTHVVFKDGSPVTLQRVRLNNKAVEEEGKGAFIHCVNSRWVTDCDTEGARVDESAEEYVVDVAEIPRGGKRRRKSMEPAALLNLGGNIVRDRQSSLGRKSLSRSPFKADALATTMEETPKATATNDVLEKENSPDGASSPATPAWIAAPSQLVQQTAPMKRVRKLELPGKEAKNRRLTFWNGAA